MDIKKISDKIYANTEDRERMEKMNSIYYSMADYIKSINPNLYNEYCDEAESVLYSLTCDEAEMIVRNMRPYGEHWNKDTVYEYLRSRGIEPNMEYYMAMNMAFNDYRNTAQMIGMDSEDFYFNIAQDFINDPDGKKHKVQKYFKEMM